MSKPKFKVGDEVVDTEDNYPTVYTILAVNNDFYVYDWIGINGKRWSQVRSHEDFETDTARKLTKLEKALT